MTDEDGVPVGYTTRVNRYETSGLEDLLEG